MASVTFSNALRWGSRWNDWKTNPMRRPRSAVRSASARAPVSIPSSRYVPLVAPSSSPAIFRNVDFPDPDGPTTATNSPCPTVSSHALSATTGGGPG